MNKNENRKQEERELFTPPPLYSSDSDWIQPSEVVDLLMRPVIDASDASDEWWTGAFDKDKREDVSSCLSSLGVSCFSVIPCQQHRWMFA
jgi:hypothetical protein